MTKTMSELMAVMMKSMVRYEEAASDPTAVWRIVSAIKRRPSEEPRNLRDLVPPAEWENEKTRRSEDLRQSNMDSTQGFRLNGTPEGNFNFPLPKGVVVTGWGEDSLPHAVIASPTLNNLNPSHNPEIAKDMEKGVSAVAKKHAQNAMVGQNMNLTTTDRGVSEEVVSEQGERSNHPITISYPFIHNLSKDIMPADLDWSIDDKHAFIEMMISEIHEQEKREPPPQSGLHRLGCLILVAAHMRNNTELGSKPFDINEKYALHRALLMALLNMVGRDGRLLSSMGLLWNLPPWPDLNDIKHYLKLLNPQSFCEVYSMAKDIEKGAAAICLRLVTSVPYLKGDTPSMLDEIVPKITEGFITSRIKSVQASFTDNLLDNPLDNVEVLQEQLESLPYLCRFQYKSSSLYIINIMEPLLQAYTERPRFPAHGDADELSAIEGRIALMVHIMAAILKIRQTIGCSQESQELIDVELSARVLRLIHTTDTGVHVQRYQELSKQRLDRAILIFVQNFGRSYVGDPAMHSAKLYARLSELLGLNNHLVLLNVIVGKIATNLKCYAECGDVLDHTLPIFLELASGYMTICIWGRAQMKFVQKFKHADWVWSLAPNEKEAISLRFQVVPYDTVILTDFEKEWVAMVEKYKLKYNKWFSDLYSCRK